MTLEPAFLAFAGIVAAAYTVQTATGFGSTLICVTFGAQLMGLDTVVRLMVPLSVIQTSYIVLRHRDCIHWPLLLRRVVPLMGLGMALAFTLLSRLSGAWLGLIFGLLVLALSARDFRTLRRPTPTAHRPINPLASAAALLSAGVIHGVYASGGPMLVYAIGREPLSKRAFRSTLSMIWVILNVVLITRFSLAGDYTPTLRANILLLLPTIPIGLITGEWVHQRVDERRFKLGVSLLLMAAATALIARYGAQIG